MTAWSIALRDIPRPDFADAVIVAIEPGGSVDPAAWARRALDPASGPRWVRAAMALRQVGVRLLGIPPADPATITVLEQGDETLVALDDHHLDFRCGISVDENARLLRVTTTVRLHGRLGRVYFAPVRLLHPIVVRAMIRTASRWFELRAP